jgi:hypothetical protein
MIGTPCEVPVPKKVTFIVRFEIINLHA